MAAVLCLTNGLFVGLAVWVLAMPDDMADAWVRGVMRMGRRMLESCSSSRVVEVMLGYGLVKDMADMVTRRLPAHESKRTREEGVVLMLGLATVVPLVGGLASRSVMGALVSLLVLAVASQTLLSSSRRKDEQALADEMPGVLRMLASALESGHTLMQAIDYVSVHEQGLAAESFARVSMRLRCGVPVDEALEGLARELDAPGVGLMTTALAISQRTGSPLRDLLRRSAVLVERQRESERLLMVRTAQVRLSVRIVCGLPPLIVCLLSLISPDFREGLVSSAGLMSIGIASTMDVLAIVLIRKIMGGVL